MDLIIAIVFFIIAGLTVGTFGGWYFIPLIISLVFFFRFFVGFNETLKEREINRVINTIEKRRK